jgi:hypothetical protein
MNRLIFTQVIDLQAKIELCTAKCLPYYYY